MYYTKRDRLKGFMVVNEHGQEAFRGREEACIRERNRLNDKLRTRKAKSAKYKKGLHLWWATLPANRRVVRPHEVPISIQSAYDHISDAAADAALKLFSHAL